jgi:glutathione S-transferase
MYPVGSAIFVNRIVLPKMLKVPGNLALADEMAEKQLPPLLAYLEGAVPAQGFLVGDGLSVGDIAVTCMLINLKHAGIPLDAGKHPKLAAYYERLTGRPSVKGLIVLECRMLESL